MGAGQGCVSLRRTQFRLADRFPAMAIFLGKNILGQVDRLEHAERPNAADHLPREAHADLGGGGMNLIGDILIVIGVAFVAFTLAMAGADWVRARLGL